MWNRFPIKILPIGSLLILIVESSYLKLGCASLNHRKKMQAEHSRLIPLTFYNITSAFDCSRSFSDLRTIYFCSPSSQICRSTLKEIVWYIQKSIFHTFRKFFGNETMREVTKCSLRNYLCNCRFQQTEVLLAISWNNNLFSQHGGINRFK